MPYPTGSIQVTGGIGTTASTDTYATHYSELGRGGLKSTEDITSRNAIPSDRREFGMEVTLLSNGVKYRLCNEDMGGVDDDKTNNDNWITVSGGGGGDFIPLSGTEVGKPLTGNIEVDATNDRVGFYSEDNDRFIGLTEDWFNSIKSEVSSEYSELEQHPGQNRLATGNYNNQYSRIDTYSNRILLNSTDDEDDIGNSGELSIENYEFRFDSKTDNGTEFDGSLLYNAEDGLNILNNPDDYININNTEGITASKEFDKQGDRKAFAQISDLEDALEDYIQEPASDGTSGQVLTTDGSGGRSWTTVSGGGGGVVAGDGLDLVGTTLNVDNTVVRTIGAQTISGIKAFINSPVIPTASSVGQAVNLGQLNASVEQEATDREFAIESAGFLQRTGTEIAFDKWAIYDSYDSPSDGDFSYDLTNAVVGMIQVAYHEDSQIPLFAQAGITVEVDEFDYTVDVVNEIIITYRQPNMVKITINSL